MNAPLIGQKLGSFRIEDKLGSGAMGIVYLGVNEANGRKAAVKVLTGEVSQKGNAYERFRREVEILQQFRHPNIVRFLAVGRFQGTSYFAMEYVRGTTLDHLMEARGELPWPEVVRLAIQTCDALHYAHQHGVVHRDLKPSNLMVSDKGQVKLTDFGIAKDLDATALTATGRTLGTAAYMAPEQIRGTPEVSHKTDLYSLGVVLYQLLTGEIPFQGATAVVLMHQHLTEPAPRPSSKITEVPVALDELVVQLMAKAPADRPWDAASVGMNLTELRDKAERGETIPMVWQRPVQAPSRGRKKSGKARKRRPSWLPRLDAPWVQTTGLAMALAALLGVAGYMLWPPSAAYLYRQAEAKMATDDPSEWIRAQSEYLDDLDRRHPAHPYREQTRAWRDRILLHRAQGRARVLESPGISGYTKPRNAAEEMFVEFTREATKDREQGKDLEAARRWRALAQALDGDDAESRPWSLLASRRAMAIDREVADRRRRVADRLKRAEEKVENGHPDEAERLRREVVDKYAQYPDLADLVDAARAELPKDPTPAPPATPTDPAPSRPPATSGAPAAPSPSTSGEPAPPRS